MTGPCDWPVSYADCSSCSNINDLSVEDRAAFETMAAEYLWNWTGQSYGICAVVVRPCLSGCEDGYGTTFWGRRPGGYTNGSGYNPVLINGGWYNVACGRCGVGCSCAQDTPASLRLPGPIVEITEVKIDGVVLNPTEYRVDNGRLLVRTDGTAWPRCQNMDLATTEPDTFEITYTRGSAVPVGGQRAAGLLASELAKAACRDSTCALPQRIQSITRQGVTIAVLDSFDDIDKGHTGIWVIDSWIASVTKPKRGGGSVRSVDVPRSGWRTSSV